MKLEIIGLCKKYKDCIAVNNLSFSIETGEITGFIGPNGAGKTTTLKIITKLENSDEGDIKIDGISTLESPYLIRNHIGYVPDFLPTNIDMTVHDYLDFFSKTYGYKTPERQNIIKELEEFTDIKTVRNNIIDSLSKGMKQKVSIARALINDPDFLILDEPASELDPRERIELRNILTILKEQGKGILISSHILSELSEICSYAVIIEKGELLKFGKIEDIIQEVTKNKTRIFKIQTINPPNEEDIKKILLSPMVSNISAIGNNIEFEFSGSEEQAGELVNNLIVQGIKLSSFGFKQENLESVFMNITKGIVQ